MNVQLLPKLSCPRIEEGERRLYQTPRGDFPSVTTILGATANKVEIQRWRERVGEAEAERIRSEAADRGNALHEMIERYLLHGIGGSGPWWDSMEHVLADVDNVRLIEGPLWHDVGYAGTADLIADFRGIPVLLDWKTARKPKKRGWINDYVLQGTAYAGAANVRYQDQGLKLQRVVVAVALEDRPAQVFQFERGELITYWHQLVGRVRQYQAMAA